MNLRDKLSEKISPGMFFAAAVIVLGLAAVPALLELSDREQSPSESSEFNRNDLMFMNMMIVHHDQAIEMAEMAENRTDNEKVLQLAQNISKAQRAENQQMTEWMQKMGYEPRTHHRMAGMASPQEMDALKDSEGAEFDRLFAELMIEHHKGGIEMARNFREVGKHSELRQMQTQMIETQQKEIEKMQKWQEQEF